MAFISINGGQSTRHNEGHYGISVKQFLDSDEIATFASTIATFLSMDWDTVIRRYIRHRAPFDTSYSDIEELAADVSAWWTVRVPDFTKIKAALTASYNPIENYNRTRVGEEDKMTGTISDVGTNNTSNGLSTTENEVAPYDSATYNKQDKSTTSYEQDVDTSNTRTFNTKNEVNVTDHGNVGVTTNQHMISEEIELRVNNNLLDIITKDFIKQFCIMLYN